MIPEQAVYKQRCDENQLRLGQVGQIALRINTVNQQMTKSSYTPRGSE